MEYKSEYVDLKQKEYKSAWELQEKYHAEIVSGKKDPEPVPGKLIFVEHPHVYTLGKSGQQNNLLINQEFLKKINATYFQSNRGGDITYHGPGQIVGYPIFDLEALGMGVKEYIGKMEQVIITCLEQYNISATQMEGSTGVWIDVNKPGARKICAIGVRVSRAVTMHGFALNVNTDLNYFSHINPCGFIDKEVTSMEKELGQSVDFEEVKQILLSKFISTFNLKV